MKKQGFGKIIISALLILCALWIAVPKVYVHALLGHVHATALPSETNGTSIQASDAKDDCEFDKYDSPVYFTIFKFIHNLIPSRPKEQSYLAVPPSRFVVFEGLNRSLRAPPRA